MSRLVVFFVVLSLAGTTPALAGDTLLQSATRAVHALARTEAGASTQAVEARSSSTASSQRASMQQQEQPGLEGSRLRKRTKLMILIGAAAAFAVVAYSIDHGVVDNTPSTLRTRKD